MTEQIKQTEALRLAELLEFGVMLGDDREQAAAELRRLHAEVERLRGVLTAIVDFVDGPAEGKRPDVFGLLINSARTALARKEPDHA